MAILPGSDFGFDKERLISRLSYTDFDGKNFISKINSDTIIDFDTIELLAPKVVEGVKRINDWVENA